MSGGPRSGIAGGASGKRSVGPPLRSDRRKGGERLGFGRELKKEHPDLLYQRGRKETKEKGHQNGSSVSGKDAQLDSGFRLLSWGGKERATEKKEVGGGVSTCQ